MPKYQHILAAIALSDEADQVMEKAAELASLYGAKLSVIHVMEPLGYAYGGDIPMDLTELQQQLEMSAKKRLTEICMNHHISGCQQQIAVGRAESEIHRAAENLNADVIVVGSHGRHGIQLLLGSTANGVLHGAGCDVLAVRIHA